MRKQAGFDYYDDDEREAQLAKDTRKQKAGQEEKRSERRRLIVLRRTDTDLRKPRGRDEAAVQSSERLQCRKGGCVLCALRAAHSVSCV